MIRLAVFLFFLLTVPGAAAWRGDSDGALRPLIRRGTVVIARGDGGDIDATLRNMAYIKRHGGRIVINGDCYSSCTLYLTMARRHVCWTARARFLFHSSYDGATGRVLPEVNDQLTPLFTPLVRTWIDVSGAMDTKRFTVMPHELLAQEYAAKTCPSKAARSTAR